MVELGEKIFFKKPRFQPAHNNDTEPEPVVIYKDCLKAHLKFGRYLRSNILMKKKFPRCRIKDAI